MIPTVNNEIDQTQDLHVSKALAILQGTEDSVLGPLRCRVSPEPFWLTPQELSFLKDLGQRLLAFYRALNHLYLQSARGQQPTWIARYLEQGKPSDLIAYGRMKRIKSQLPGVIRPDLILTDDGMRCTELDAVPGGFGATACLSRLYGHLGFDLVGGSDGIVEGFARMIRETAGKEKPNLAIVVSEESRDYRSEMAWLAEQLTQQGISTVLLEPAEVKFTEEGLFYADPDAEGRLIPIQVLYRFFELFDLKNIPKSELILYGAKKGLAALTPPIKTYLEEKMAFALFCHPALKGFWWDQLGQENYEILDALFPKTWVLDPQELPPYGVIPHLEINGKAVSDWSQLDSLSQRERQYVIKPSGFSPLAWGSKGVKIGHDLSGQDWQATLKQALQSFEEMPSLLQVFHKGRQVKTLYLDRVQEAIKTMLGRVRLCPYYFVSEGEAELSGVLATICPSDKKLIHGMSDAVMTPCALRTNQNGEAT